MLYSCASNTDLHSQQSLIVTVTQKWLFEGDVTVEGNKPVRAD